MNSPRGGNNLMILLALFSIPSTVAEGEHTTKCLTTKHRQISP